jgi:hypothetical protein
MRRLAGHARPGRACRFGRAQSKEPVMTDFGVPPGSFPPAVPPVPPSAGARTGPPWEQSGPAVQRYIDTIKAVLLDPATTFKNVRREGGLGAPVTYYLIGALLSVLANSIFQLAGFGAFGRYGGMGDGLVSGLLISAVAVVAGIFIASGIVHVMLMLFGGARYGYETTLRTLAYGYGSASPIGVIPFCGGLIAVFWGLFCSIMGLAEMQETSVGKAAAAILVPGILCCLLGALFIGTIMAMIGMAAYNAS